MHTEFCGFLEEWLKDHRLFAATLEELAGQLEVLQPPQRSSQSPRPSARGSGGGGGGDERKELLARLMERAPSEQLRAFVEGRMPTSRLQRTLPEQLNDNMRLLSILAAEMRALVQRLEQLAHAASAAALQGGDTAAGATDSAAAADTGSAAAAGDGQGSVVTAAGATGAEEALLLAAVADGAAKETLLIAKAAAGITLTTPPEEVSAAATILQLEPFLSSTLLAAVKEGPAEGTEGTQEES